MQKPHGGLEGPQPLQLSIRRGGFATPRTAIFVHGRDTVVNESPVGFQSRGVLRKSEAKTTGTNNRHLAVFAPGNFPQEISAKTVVLLHN
ncbi:MAG: hypothetical protein II697_00325, partial [Clostridia bacterium]|nr:hypothetical protein [Clostridia bacterium]